MYPPSTSMIGPLVGLFLEMPTTVPDFSLPDFSWPDTTAGPFRIRPAKNKERMHAACSNHLGEAEILTNRQSYSVIAAGQLFNRREKLWGLSNLKTLSDAQQLHWEALTS